jgi:hypothetical protein
MPRILRRGRGPNPTGGGVKRTGMGIRRRRGGSMRHRGVPASIRTEHVNKLNKIIKSAAKPGKSRASVAKKLKNWASSAHKTAQKYGLYTKGAHALRLGYNMYNAKKGNNSIGYTAPQSIQYVD